MSTLRLDTIQNQAAGNSSTPDEIYSGRAKAWVNFDGTFGTSPFTVANGGIRAAFNVSSITDDGTGTYRVNFTTAFTDTNYTAVTALDHASGISLTTSCTTETYSTTDLSLLTCAASASQFDPDSVNVAIFR